LQNQSRIDTDLLQLRNQEIEQKNMLLQEKDKECELMGLVHRRPRGFAVLGSWSLLRRKFRRIIPGIPVLLYLAGLTVIGHYLHLMWTRRHRS
jgi:hypothetical protein